MKIKTRNLEQFEVRILVAVICVCLMGLISVICNRPITFFDVFLTLGSVEVALELALICVALENKDAVKAFRFLTSMREDYKIGLYYFLLSLMSIMFADIKCDNIWTSGSFNVAFINSIGNVSVSTVELLVLFGSTLIGMELISMVLDSIEVPPVIEQDMKGIKFILGAMMSVIVMALYILIYALVYCV